MRFLFLCWFVGSCLTGWGNVLDSAVETGGNDVETVVSWLLEPGRDLERVRFAEVIRAATGTRVIPVDRDDEATAWVLGEIGAAMREVLGELGAAEHPVHAVGRINEASRFVEDLLVKKLAATEELEAGFPRTAAGVVQRSGYPDIRLVDTRTGKVFYLDPKLYADGSETSSFRTFYFEPKVATNKVRDDAVHLIVGIAHGGRSEGRWRFLGWKLVDLAEFEVRLKAEFQGSNRDLYREEAVVGEGGIEF